MTKLKIINGRLVTLVETKIFDPPVTVIDGIVIRPFNIATVKCDCGQQAISELHNYLRGRVAHCCESSKCIMRIINYWNKILR